MDPVFNVTFVTVKDYSGGIRLDSRMLQAVGRTEFDRSTVLAMKNGPFSVVLSELTTTMLTGLGSPAENVQLMTLLVFATLQSASVTGRGRQIFGRLYQ